MIIRDFLFHNFHFVTRISQRSLSVVEMLFSSFQLHQHFKCLINVILFYNDRKLIGS